MAYRQIWVCGCCAVKSLAEGKKERGLTEGKGGGGGVSPDRVEVTEGGEGMQWTAATRHCPLDPAVAA